MGVVRIVGMHETGWRGVGEEEGGGGIWGRGDTNLKNK